ncbi:hypothetical protein N836_18200 [Leptolyngbya sp. Heron Island J]|uniref:DUF6930 domain-containing protein n=1 Tax=Leptolyngbya sp. Heron Island J TaxID=1385935 RepID=UPI0003B9D223|nr:hypothetical protein [Leptolyngbya sp. Heron Island J]ESA34180.1 hypothetical protein N836_18200 [Leptolyngbya sp. Heron Island J]
MPPLSPFTRRRIQKLPQTNSVWEGGRCSMPDVEHDDRDCILWVDGHQGYVRSVDMVAANSGYEAVARSLLQAIEHPQGPAEPSRPQRVVVNDRELQFFLRGVLQELDIDVVYGATLPWVDEIFDHLLSQISVPSSSVPAAYDDCLREKALALWHQAPWYRLSEQELLAVELNRWDTDTLYVSILGMADVDYGLLFYRSLESLLHFREQVLNCDRTTTDLSTGMSPQMLQQVFLTQDCFFLNYVVERPRQTEPDNYEVGSIHPLEGMRHELDETEAAILIITLEALNRFFQKAPDPLDVLQPLQKTLRIPNPIEGDSPKQCTVKIKSLPEISASLMAETEQILDMGNDIENEPILHDDLVPDGSLILLTKLSPERLTELRKTTTRYQATATEPANANTTSWPVVIIQTSRPKAMVLFEQIESIGGIQAMCFNPGHDPFNQLTFQLGIWQAGDRSLHLFHEYDSSDRYHREALEKWHQQQIKSRGRCGIMIAAGVTGRNRGNPQPKDIVAFLEVNFCAPEMLNLEPLVLSYAIE